MLLITASAKLINVNACKSCEFLYVNVLSISNLAYEYVLIGLSVYCCYGYFVAYGLK